MSNGLARLATRFLGEPASLETAKAASGTLLEAEDCERLGLITAALDGIDWDDEVRIFLEERASFSADGLTGMEANLRFAGPETMETKIFGRLTAWQNWIFQRPNAAGAEGALKRYGSGVKANFNPERVSMQSAADTDETRRTQQMPETTNVDYSTKIPNNVGLMDDQRVLKALEQWHPGYIDWWMTMGPEGFQTSDVYLRTAISIDPKGWAKFDYVKMPDYRWGILLAPRLEDRQVNFGIHKGAAGLAGSPRRIPRHAPPPDRGAG